jgi:hypothetical protein
MEKYSHSAFFFEVTVTKSQQPIKTNNLKTLWKLGKKFHSPKTWLI